MSSTLQTSPLLACMLLKYENMMSGNLKEFVKKVVLRLDIESEINKEDGDMLADTLLDIEAKGDYSDEILGEFLELIERHEVNIRKPYSVGR